MISRPTTSQILNDCAREVRETVAPLINDPTVRVRLEMLEQLLASCAVRAGNEIAWMTAECEVMERYAAAVAAVFPEATEVAERLGAYRAGRSGLLDLETRVRTYDLAGRAFAAALDVAIARGHVELSSRARELVLARRDRETQTRPGFYLPGRS